MTVRIHRRVARACHTLKMGQFVNPAAYATVAEVIRSRRTTLRTVEDVTVPADTIDELCELAAWAPAHKRTWPWRFAAFSGAGRGRLGEAFVADMLAYGIGDAAKHAKTLTKYNRTPNTVVVGCIEDENSTIHDENRDAVAAAIQNFLLAATTRGIATFWSTPPVIDGPEALKLCGFGPTDRIIGVVYLGFATDDDIEAPLRPLPRVLHIE